jgi:hypothetical protein
VTLGAGDQRPQDRVALGRLVVPRKQRNRAANPISRPLN